MIDCESRRLPLARLLIALSLTLSAAFFALAAPSFAATWINPKTGARYAPTVVIIPATTVPVSASQTSGALTGQAAGTSAGTTTVTTSTVVTANGTTITTTNSVTSYSQVSNVAVNASYKLGATTVTMPTVTLASLGSGTAGQQKQTVPVTGGTVVFTVISTAGNTVTIQAQQFLFFNSLPQPQALLPQVVLTLDPPATTTTSTPATTAAPFEPTTPSTPVVQPVGNGVENAVQAAANLAQIEIARCGIETPNCVADALDAYATQLEKIAPSLPPSMRNLPAVIHEAARKVRAAKTKAEAIGAIQSAIATVRQSVQLLRAVDVDQRTVARDVGAQTVSVLEAAQAKLERVTGL